MPLASRMRQDETGADTCSYQSGEWKCRALSDGRRTDADGELLAATSLYRNLPAYPR